MPLTEKDVYSTVDRMEAVRLIISKTEAATTVDDLKAIIADLCRVVLAEVESGHSAQFD